MGNNLASTYKEIESTILKCKRLQDAMFKMATKNINAIESNPNLKSRYKGIVSEMDKAEKDFIKFTQTLRRMNATADKISKNVDDVYRRSSSGYRELRSQLK